MSTAWAGQRRAHHADAQTAPRGHLAAFEQHLADWHYPHASAARQVGYTTPDLLFLHDNAFDTGSRCGAGRRYPADVIFDSAAQHTRRTGDTALVLQLVEALHHPNQRNHRTSDFIDDLAPAAHPDRGLPFSPAWEARWDWPREYIAHHRAAAPDPLTRTQYRLPATLGARHPGRVTWPRWHDLVTETSEDLDLIAALLPTIGRGIGAPPVSTVVAWARHHDPTVALVMSRTGLTHDEGLAWDGNPDDLSVLAGLRA